MKPVVRHALLTTLALTVVAAAGAGIFIASGAYNIAADDPHTTPVHKLLETLRERSIETRAARLQVPDLAEQRRVVEGSGNYQAMCVGCHLAPGMVATELSRGLYPAPPNLTQRSVEPRRAFWAIKHGIKASGMPAWGKSMNDETVWNMAAFLVRLPKLDAQQYEELVASSDGHSHGGADHHGAGDAGHGTGGHDGHAAPMQAGEHGMPGEQHPHAPEAAAALRAATDVPSAAAATATRKPAVKTHLHADGKSHDHPAGSK